MLQATLAKSSFIAGEVSPELISNEELSHNQTGLEKAENVVVLLEGGITRRPGTGMTVALKTEAQKGLLVPYRFDPATAYLLIFNGSTLRLLKNGAVVGGPYELAVPYAEADLSNMRWTYSGNAVFIGCDGQRPQTLLRTADTNWSIAGYANIGGPVEPQNLDKTKTITASAQTGTGITLTGQNQNWQAGNIGGVWRLDESDLSLIASWKAQEAITIPTAAGVLTGTKIGDMTNLALAFDGNPATGATKLASNFYIGTSLAASEAVYSCAVTMNHNGAGAAFSVLTLYGRVGAAPANATDGTSLISIGVNVLPTASTFTLYSGDTSTNWDHIWVALTSGFVPTWTVSEITRLKFTASGTPVLRRYLGRVYQAIAGTNSGAAPPVQLDGDVLSETGGIVWRYLHRDRGFVRITAVTNANLATADVLETLPASVTVRATYRWFAASWDGVMGWPNRVVLANNAIWWARQDRFWRTKPGSFFDHDTTDPTDPGQALSGRFISDRGSLVWCEWMAVAGGMVFGMRDGEWIVRGAGLFDPLTAQNIQPWEDQHAGSCPQVLARFDGGALFIGRSRQRLHYATLDPLAQRIPEQEVTLSARHILKPLAQRVSYQQDPNCVAWIYCADGSLAGVSQYKEQKISGWHRHPLTNGIVEDVAAIASADESESQQYFIVRRTINGATRRFVEKLQPFFKPVDPLNVDARGAWFVDCGTRYQGAPITTVTGAGYLEGQTVKVHADGAMHPDCVVTGGQFTLQRAAADVIYGLRVPYRARLLPLNLQLQTGTTVGKKKKANHLKVRMINSAGGQVVVNPDEGSPVEPLDETGTLMYGAAVPLKTGLQRVTLQSAIAQANARGVELDDCTVEVSGDDTMPFTLVALYPDVDLAEM